MNDIHQTSNSEVFSGTALGFDTPDPNRLAYLRARSDGAPFSRMTRAGDVIFLSGQLGIGRERRLADGVAAQTRQAMQNISADLEEIGLSLTSVAKVTVMLTDISQLGEFNSAYLSFWDAARLPARSAFAVSGLAAGALVEIECVAYAVPAMESSCNASGTPYAK